jgi:hypothetical protein
VGAVTGRTQPAGASFQSWLKDGVALCELINAIAPAERLKIAHSAMPFKQAHAHAPTRPPTYPPARPPAHLTFPPARPPAHLTFPPARPPAHLPTTHLLSNLPTSLVAHTHATTTATHHPPPPG